MKNSVLCFGHRGSPKQEPENTLPSFEYAMKSGAQGFECDLRMTEDSQIVVFHDDDLQRLCGSSLSIENMSYEAVAKMRVKAKAGIPRLNELLTTFSQAQINLEIKSSSRDTALVDQLLPQLLKDPDPSRFLLSSFSIPVLKHLRAQQLKLNSSLRMGFIFYELSAEANHFLQESDWLYSWHPHFKLLGKLPEKNMKNLWVWTPNTEAEWKFCLNFESKLEAIITDKPDLLLGFLDAH